MGMQVERKKGKQEEYAEGQNEEAGESQSNIYERKNENRFERPGTVKWIATKMQVKYGRGMQEGKMVRKAATKVLENTYRRIDPVGELNMGQIGSEA